MGQITENIFGLRIKRAAELIGDQGRDAFWRTGIALDAKLISIVTALYEEDAQSSTDLTKVTGFSRQLVESRLRTLEESGYVTSAISKDDARKRTFSLDKKRLKEVERAVAQIIDFEEVYEELWREIGIDLGDAILKLERALTTKPLLARLCQKFPKYGEAIKVSGYES